MSGVLKKAFANLFKDLTIDRNFIRDFDSWYQGILTRNDQHTSFFGSTLLGVYSIQFTTDDFNYFWDVLLQTDREDFREVLHSLTVLSNDGQNMLDKKNKVITDETNVAFFYLMHRIETSRLRDAEKKSLIVRLLFILQFKFITSRHFNDWEHLANKERALATYNALSNQVKLKSYNSWYEYLNARSMEMYVGGERRKDFLFYIKHFDDDRKILQLISGVSTNIGKMLNRWNKVFYTLKLNEQTISMSSALTETEDGLTLKDLSGLAQYRLYLETNVSTKTTFVKLDLVETISKVARVSKRSFTEVLEYFSDNYGSDEDVSKFVDNSLTYGLSRLADERRNLRDIDAAYKFLVNAFGSTRSTSETLERLKERGERAIKKSKAFPVAKNNQITITATYIVIWTLLSGR